MGEWQFKKSGFLHPPESCAYREPSITSLTALVILFCNIHKRSEFSNCKEDKEGKLVPNKEKKEEGNLVPKKEKKEKSRTQLW